MLLATAKPRIVCSRARLQAERQPGGWKLDLWNSGNKRVPVNDTEKQTLWVGAFLHYCGRVNAASEALPQLTFEQRGKNMTDF